MLISNGYGRVVSMDFEDYINLTHQEWQDHVIAGGHGEFIENPFHDSFSKAYKNIDDNITDEIVEEILKEIEDNSLDYDID